MVSHLVARPPSAQLLRAGRRSLLLSLCDHRCDQVGLGLGDTDVGVVDTEVGLGDTEL